MKRILFAATAAILLPAAAAAVTLGAGPAGHKALQAPMSQMVEKAAQCQQRVGPFVTQNTAWQRWRQASYAGYAVSNGVVPCYDSYGSRGYCFFVFYGC